MNDSWRLDKVAKAQATLVKTELERPEFVPPYANFIKAMQFIYPQSYMSFLDVGCGAGGYAQLIERYFPKVVYTGTDFSPAMIKEARKLNHQARFEVREFLENDFGKYDVVMESSSVEYAGAFPALEGMLTRCKGRVILHRLRLTLEKSHFFNEPTYCGESATHFMWNLDELKNCVSKFGQIVFATEWDGQMTMVVQK